jgi:uncharacterized protein YcbX
VAAGTIGEIWRYTVKSVGGAPLAATTVGRSGIVGDRRWALRDEETGKVASAKLPRPWRFLLDCAAVTDDDGETLRFQLPDGIEHAGNDPALLDALRAALRRPVALVVADGSDIPIALATEKSSFVDVAAIHLVTTASLRALADLAPGAAVDVRRFRPNLVVDTGDASGFVETDWLGRRVAIGDELVLRVADNATRCVMTTLAQGDLPADRSVLQALAEHNRQEFAGLGRSACLGVYCEVDTPGPVHTGDAVTVLDEPAPPRP